jgi:hypothetical protein
VPFEILEFAGVITTDTRLTHDTVRVVTPDMVPDEALIFACPQFLPLAYALPELDTFATPAG